MNIDVEAKVKEKIVEQLEVDIGEVTNEANMFNDLGADSLDLVELTMSIEEEFNIEIEDAEAEKIKTVGQMIEGVKSKIKL